MATKFYDLSQPFGANTPLWPWPQMTDVQIHRVSFPERDRFPGGVNKLTTVITTKFHASTHMDAPSHVLQDGLMVDQIPLSSCYGTGVIVDMRHKGKWDIITAEDLENATPKIEEGILSLSIRDGITISRPNPMTILITIPDSMTMPESGWLRRR